MLDHAPREPEWRSWTWVLLCIGLIYATIPLARMLVKSVDQQVGREVLLYACVLLVAIGGLACWRNLRQRELTRAAYLCLLAVLGLFAATLYQLRSIPEEALHVAQYALLGVLLFRALSHRLRDYSIYPLGLLLTSMVGMVDEYIQWVVPSRVFDLRDIAINAFSGLLAQLGLAAGLRPRLVARAPTAQNWRRLGNWSAGALLLFMVSFVNTPQRVAWYAPLLGLEFLLDSNSMMAQYGYLHVSPAGAKFRSRFDAAQLQSLNLSRGEEAGALAGSYLVDRYPEFLRHYTVVRDPYVHEIGVRLFRRMRHVERVEESPQHRSELYRVAYHEDEILKAFFPMALPASGFAWDEALQSEIRESAVHDETPYRSPVSRALVTRVSEAQVWLLFGLGVGVLLASSRIAARYLAQEPA